GVKTRQGVLGLGGRAVRGDCSTAGGNQVQSILNWAMDAGKSGGLVSTARITHATPAAAYAKCAERQWESDRKIPDSEKKLYGHFLPAGHGESENPGPVGRRAGVLPARGRV
ncbi:hypothetical protein EGW08_018162, partial [Elysia chlorotica]